MVINSYTVLGVISFALIVSGLIFLVYNLYHVIKIDAKSRGMSTPGLIAFLTTFGGRNAEGLLIYFIARRKHPVISISDEEKGLMSKGKKAAGLGIIVVVIGTVLAIYCVIILKG